MLNLKKTALAVLAFGSSAVFAGSMGPVCSAVNVTVPCESTAWAFGAKALYLKPSFTHTGTSDVFTPASYAAEPNYNWGFQIEGAYHFNTGNDLNLNWYHVSKSKSRNYGAAGALTAVGPNGISSLAGVSGSSEIDPKWDAVNIEVGQHVDFGDNKAIRFHGGAQWARVANDIDRTSSVVALNVTTPSNSLGAFTHTTDRDATYNGFGPRVGADMSYDWGNGLGIYANAATGLLAGTISHSETYSDSLGNAFANNASRTAIVPVIDAKLGATYTYAMAQGDLTLDAGWMWVNYFNAVEQPDNSREDFGLQGPFVGLKWLGNIA